MIDVHQLYSDLHEMGYYVHSPSQSQCVTYFFLLSSSSAPVRRTAGLVFMIQKSTSSELDLEIYLFGQETPSIEKVRGAKLDTWLALNTIKKAIDLSAEINSYEQYMRLIRKKIDAVTWNP